MTAGHQEGRLQWQWLNGMGSRSDLPGLALLHGRAVSAEVQLAFIKLQPGHAVLSHGAQFVDTWSPSYMMFRGNSIAALTSYYTLGVTCRFVLSL